jgi:hypothetical protein
MSQARVVGRLSMPVSVILYILSLTSAISAQSEFWIPRPLFRDIINILLCEETMEVC